MIDFEGIRKTYVARGKRVEALDGVDLHVAPGEFVSVEGPSGSGKTTLLFVAAGLIRPTAGSVIVDGASLTSCWRSQLALMRLESFGFVFQMFYLVPYLTAAENVMIPVRLLRERSGEGPSPKERAAELLERFGLTDRADHYPSELSAGERQRVAIARAVANRPKVLFADEPTGNLDSRAADAVFAAFDEIHRDGTTLLVVTHDVRAAGKAGRTLHLEAGRLRD